MRMTFAPAVLAGVVLCSSALADCEVRNPTPAELQYKARVAAALKEALPAAPAKWTLVSSREIDDLGLCDPAPVGFAVRLVATYSYKPTKEESDRLYAERRKLQSEIDALKQLPPQVAKERQGWLDKMSEANRASNAAYKSGDKALAKQKDAEADGYSAKGREVRDRYLASVRGKVEELEARAKTLNPGETTVLVRIAANESRFSDVPTSETGSQLVFGKAPVAHPGLKVQGVRVVVQGPAQKRREIEAALDKEKLKRLAQ